nr:MAG TPA: Calcium-activated potassium channel subunit beta-4 [Caudoviricetes sp.]
MNKKSRGELSSYPCFFLFISLTHVPNKAFSENDKRCRHYRFKCAILPVHWWTHEKIPKSYQHFPHTNVDNLVT